MNKKKEIVKILIVLLCLGGVTLFALVESGMNLPFVQAYKNNFKKNVSGISALFGIELPLEMQLYLDDMSAPTPKPTMIPAEEQAALERALGYPSSEEEEELPRDEGNDPLTTKAPIKPKIGGDTLPIAFDSAENSRFIYKDHRIICVNETRYAIYNEKGRLIHEETIQMQEPMVVAKGKYTLVSETGGKKLILYKGNKLLYETEMPENIISCDMSEKGDVVLVTEKKAYKGQVAVLNNNGKTIFAWDSGSYEILDASVSKKRRVGIALLNTDSGADCFITCFDVNGKNQYETEVLKDTLIFDIEFCDENLDVFADNKCMDISKSGKVRWVYDYGEKNLTRYSIDENGCKLLVFDSNNTGEMVTVSGKGKIKGTKNAGSMPDTVDIKNSHIAYNSGRDIYVSNYKGKKMLTAFCDSDVKQLHIINSKKVLCVYSTSFQIKKVTKYRKNDTEEVRLNSGDEAPNPEEVKE